MRSAILAMILLGVAGVVVCAQESITLLLLNGRIWTVNPEQKEAEAVAVAGNRIVAVGTTSQISKLRQSRTQVVDLEGKRVLPGFNDAHVHFYSGGSSLAGPQLRYSKSEQEFRATLAAFAEHTS